MKYTEGKFKLRSHNKSYCLIDVVTKAGLTNRYICIISCLCVMILLNVIIELYFTMKV